MIGLWEKVAVYGGVTKERILGAFVMLEQAVGRLIWE
jgi:hypothetical protein